MGREPGGGAGGLEEMTARHAGPIFGIGNNGRGRVPIRPRVAVRVFAGAHGAVSAIGVPAGAPDAAQRVGAPFARSFSASSRAICSTRCIIGPIRSCIIRSERSVSSGVLAMSDLPIGPS